MTTEVEQDPGYELVIEEGCLEVIEEWLEQQHVTLWSRFFSVREAKGRKEAAEWLYSKVFVPLAEFCQES